MKANSQSSLLKKWSLCAQKWEKRPRAPFIFPGDEILLKRETASSVCIGQKFADWVAASEFGSGEDKRLHLDLLPAPFLGNLEKASVFLLMLNAGLKPSAFYLEEKMEEVRKEKLKNLGQTNGEDPFPFSSLDPALAWTPSADYWRKKFKSLLMELQRDGARSYEEAAQLLARNVACIQLVPYCSRNYGLSAKVSQGLESKRLAIEYVKNILMPKAEAGSVVVVVMRGNKHWNLSEIEKKSKNVFVYEGSMSHGAHLNAESDAGKAVLAKILSVGSRR